jgi:Mrp family chromosome partitioning ATPase
MDRLQVAIQKARAQRRATHAGTAPALTETMTFPQGPAAPATPRPAPEAPPEAPAAPAAEGGADALWAALAPVNTRARRLRDNRLVTVGGGKAAVPYDLLRTRMLQQARAQGWKRIGIVSPSQACGKTTAAANLAFAFSRQPDLRVVLLDLDLRRPRLAAMLGQKVETGMEDVLTGRLAFADHALRLESNVALGLNKSGARNSSELLQSGGTETALRAIEADLAPDLMVVDLPPMLATDDNFGFLGRVDAVLVLAAAEETAMDQIEVTLRQISDLTQVMGIVLNKCRHNSSAYGYDSKYYY